ncbi:hypothetical protein D3C85_681780 [compost metagenome]
MDASTGNAKIFVHCGIGALAVVLMVLRASTMAAPTVSALLPLGPPEVCVYNPAVTSRASTCAVVAICVLLLESAAVGANGVPVKVGESSCAELSHAPQVPLNRWRQNIMRLLAATVERGVESWNPSFAAP